jgi:hypothetical protein
MSFRAFGDSFSVRPKAKTRIGDKWRKQEMYVTAGMCDGQNIGFSLACVVARTFVLAWLSYVVIKTLVSAWLACAVVKTLVSACLECVLTRGSRIGMLRLVYLVVKTLFSTWLAYVVSIILVLACTAKKATCVKEHSLNY